MKRIHFAFLLSACALTLTTHTSFARGLGVYGRCYAMGTMNKISEHQGVLARNDGSLMGPAKAALNGVLDAAHGQISASGEGLLYMGENSQVVTEKPYECGTETIPGSNPPVKKTKICANPLNPIPFSMVPGKKFEESMELNGQEVFMTYRRERVRIPGTGATRNSVDSIEQTDPKMPMNDCMSSESGGLVATRSLGVKTADGKITAPGLVGHVTQLCYEGTTPLDASWEAIVQQGASNNFQHVTIHSEELAQCIKSQMKTGKRVNVMYDQAWFRNPLVYKTNYRVVGSLKVKSAEEIREDIRQRRAAQASAAAHGPEATAASAEEIPATPAD